MDVGGIGGHGKNSKHGSTVLGRSMPNPPKRLTDRKREAIMRAAVDEFRTAGYEATSMDRIAAAAGVSKRTGYNHFPSKEELFGQMLEQLWDSSASSVDLAYRTDLPLDQQLKQLLMQKLELLGDSNFIDLARVALAEIIHSPERAQGIVPRSPTDAWPQSTRTLQAISCRGW
ncbi:hypothetical protein G6F57_018153 [Rhizopus arrhizus]|nr:hypothetical protein G6F57_018153 [Rhizopus arrhizus]